MKVANDKRLMIPITAFLAVCVLTLTVLLILDATGVLYNGFSDKGKDPGTNGTAGSTVELLDGKVHESGEYQYRLLTDGTAELYYFITSTATDIEVPSEIDGYKVTVIGDECFVWMAYLKTVSIPDGVTRIGVEAFSGNGSMVEIRLPSTLSVIGRDAFKGCSSAINVEFSGDISTVDVGTGNDALLTAINGG